LMESVPKFAEAVGGYLGSWSVSMSASADLDSTHLKVRQELKYT